MPRKKNIVDELDLKEVAKSANTIKKENKKKPSTKPKKNEKASTSDIRSSKKDKNILSKLNKKTSTKKTDTKSKTTTKKISTKKTTKSKTIDKKSTKLKVNPKAPIVEYYDLPYRYNQTVVKVLAQTPTTLFVYWDISDSDRANFETFYGKDFFYATRPVLIVHNKTKGYSFEIDINDFANSWYIHVVNSNCQYDIELGRRPNPNTYIPQIKNDYIYVSSSNIMDSPNDHILFEKPATTLYFKNVKNNHVLTKQITDFPIIQNMRTIYNIPNLYKNLYSKLYNNEILNEYENKDVKINNPSSGNTSSNFI